MQNTRLKFVWGTLCTGWEPFGVVLPNVRGAAKRTIQPALNHTLNIHIHTSSSLLCKGYIAAKAVCTGRLW